MSIQIPKLFIREQLISHLLQTYKDQITSEINKIQAPSKVFETLTFIGGIFLTLASYQILPKRVNMISNIGNWTKIAGWTTLCLSAIAVFIKKHHYDASTRPIRYKSEIEALNAFLPIVLKKEELAAWYDKAQKNLVIYHDKNPQPTVFLCDKDPQKALNEWYSRNTSGPTDKWIDIAEIAERTETLRKVEIPEAFKNGLDQFFGQAGYIDQLPICYQHAITSYPTVDELTKPVMKGSWIDEKGNIQQFISLKMKRINGNDHFKPLALIITSKINEVNNQYYWDIVFPQMGRDGLVPKFFNYGEWLLEEDGQIYEPQNKFKDSFQHLISNGIAADDQNVLWTLSINEYIRTYAIH